MPEGCSQCKKAKRVCPGYRNQGDLIFRDESSNVVHKFKVKEAREAKKKAPAPPATDIIASEDEAALDSRETSLEIVQQQDSPLAVEYNLGPTLEERATSIFVFHYVIGLNGPSKGHLYNLADLAREQTLEDCLITAPEDVTKDSTLMAIQVLGIFETVAGCKRRSLKDWSEHLNGAAAVIKLRGPDQIKTRPGRQMLIQATADLMIVCLQGRTKLPDYIREYVNAAIAEIKTLTLTEEPTFIIQECMMRYTDLNADLMNGVITDPEIILSKCLEIDGFLLPIVTDVPPGWEFETVFTDVESDFVYNGRYDIYWDYWMASMWNALRIIRAMLNDKIRNTLLAGFSSKPPRFTEPQYAAQFQISTETLYQIQDEILGTVVQHMGRPHNKDPNPLGRDTIVDGSPPIPMSGGAFLVSRTLLLKCEFLAGKALLTISLSDRCGRFGSSV